MSKRIILIFFLVLISSTNALAWDDCPKGLVNDPYPGECSKYIDTDNDGICDHSQPAPENRGIAEEVEEAEEVGEAKEIEKSDNSSKILLASSIVLIHLIVILIYVKFKKNR